MQRVDGALDRPVQVVATGGMFGAESGTVRTGTPLPEGEGWVTVAELIARAGGRGAGAFAGAAHACTVSVADRPCPGPEFAQTMHDSGIARG